MRSYRRARTVMLAVTVCSALGAPAHGQVVLRTPSLEVGGGLALRVGDDARRFDQGASARISAVWRASDRPEWMLDAGWLRQDARALYALPFLIGGQLYFPLANEPRAIQSFTIQGGLRRALLTGPVRPYVEGLAGGGIVTEPSSLVFRLNRSPDPLLDRTSSSDDLRRVGFAPSLALGAGIEVDAPARVGISASIGAQWTPVRGTEAPLLPIHLAAVWPTRLAQAAATARSGRAPRLTLATGASVRLRPSELGDISSETGVVRPGDSRDDWNPGAAVGFGIEMPLSDAVLVGVHGEQAVHPLRGGLTPRFPSLSVRRDASVTTLLATATVRGRVRALRPYLRAGVGWGAGGLERTHHLEVDPLGNLVDIHSVDVSETYAFAQSAIAGVEVRIVDHASLFGEGGATRLARPNEDTVLAPITLGIVLD